MPAYAVERGSEAGTKSRAFGDTEHSGHAIQSALPEIPEQRRALDVRCHIPSIAPALSRFAPNRVLIHF
jgi:hypothetical protein